MATTPIKYRISSVAPKPTADSIKGAPLTSLEIDGNFRSIKDSIDAEGARLDASIATQADRIDDIILNGIGSILARHTATATAGQTVFDLPFTYSPGANNLVVFVNGLLSERGADYTETSGTRVTFNSGLEVGQEVTFLTNVSPAPAAPLYSVAGITSYTLTSNGVLTSFALPVAVLNKDNTQVFVNGIYQEKANYSIAGSTLAFSEAPVAGKVEVVVQSSLAIGENLATQVSYTPAGTGAVATTVQSKLSSLELADYAALRAFTGTEKHVQIVAAGISGLFQYDSTDTTSSDNGGTIIVSSNGRRWKRIFYGAVNIQWFGAKGDWDGTTGTDDTSAFQAAINFLLSKKTVSGNGIGKLYSPKGNYLVNGTLSASTVYGFVFEGDGISATTITRTSDSGNLFSITGYGRVSFRDMFIHHKTTTAYTTWTNVLFNMNGTGGGNHFSLENIETFGFGQVIKYNAASANEDTNFFSKLRCSNFKTFLYARSSQAIINSIRDSTFFGTCQSVFDISGFGHLTLDTCNIVVSGKVFDLYSGFAGPQSNYILRNTKLEHWPQGGAVGTTQLIVMNSDMQVSFLFDGGGFAGGSPDPAVNQIVARGTLSQIIFNGGNWDSNLKIECYDSVPASVFGSNPHVKSFIKFKGAAISPTPTNVLYNTTGAGISYMGVVWQDCQDRPNLCLTGLSNGQTYNSSVPSDDLVNKATFTGANSGGNILNGATATVFPYPHYGQPAFLSKVRVFIYSSGVFVSGTIKMFANSAKTIQIGTTQTIPNGAVTVPILYDLTIPANTVITEGVFVEIANTNGIYAYGRVFIETISI